jgi:poly(A)-specific ribonuclease
LRWIFDALIGSDLDGISTKWFSEESGDKPELTQSMVDREFNETKAALKTKNHVIVGHNLFMDLVYLYKTFVGTLPSRVEEFQQEINGLFPFIIDTKYLATHRDGSMNKREGLKDLLEPFKKTHIPLVVLHEQHTSYGAVKGKSHEAGFDSSYPG